ncbi:MAG: DUF6077 domain-containing protein [Rubrobacteraceae bacterium]
MKNFKRIAYTRLFEILLVALGAISLLILGPLRQVFEEVQLVPFLAAFLLFLAPGAMVWRRFLSAGLPGVTVIPTAFVLSAGTFALLAVPMLVNHWSLNFYIWISGAIVVASLVWAALRALRGGTVEGGPEGDPNAEAEVGSPIARGLLWGAFLGMGGVLAYISRARGPGLYGDIWVYLAWIRDFLNTDRLALQEPYLGSDLGISRASINGWLLEQAALSRVSGIDPIVMMLEYLNPILILVALMSIFTLALILFKNRTAALIAGCTFALFYLIYLFPSVLTFGGEFAARQVEDKFATKFVFLPMALAAAAVFLEMRKLRYAAFFALICWSVMAIHPVGLAIIGLSMSGFAILYLAVNWRSGAAWARIAGLGIAGASVLFLPALYVLATGKALSDVLKDADINSNDPDVLANMVFARPYKNRILELGEDLYIMHPALLLNAVILVSLVLGIPFLVMRLKRGLAPQLLLGILLLTLIVCYVPQVATFVGDNIVVPGQLWRLAWPIPLAALMTAGWMIWEAARVVGRFLRNRGLSVAIAGFTPVLIMATLMAAATPVVMNSIDGVYEAAQLSPEEQPRLDPIFPWMRDNITEESIMLAPEEANVVIGAWSASANVVNYRGGLVLDVLPELEEHATGEIEVPQGALDVRSFYSNPTLQEGMAILRRQEVDYVITYKDSMLGAQIADLPGFAPVETPSKLYSLYAVDREELLFA